MKRIILCLLFCLFSNVCFGQHFDNYSEAYWKGKTANKYVFVYFTMDNCRYCKMLEEQTFEDETVRDTLTQHYVIGYCHIGNKDNLSWYEQCKRSLSRSNYDINGFPNYLLVDPMSGKIIRMGKGFKNPENFLNWLRTNRE